jgi:hypothetical protein
VELKHYRVDDIGRPGAGPAAGGAGGAAAAWAVTTEPN